MGFSARPRKTAAAAVPRRSAAKKPPALAGPAACGRDELSVYQYVNWMRMILRAAASVRMVTTSPLMA